MGVKSTPTTLRLMAIAAALMMSSVTALDARSPQPEGRPSTSAADISVTRQSQILILAADDFTRPWVQLTVDGFRDAVLKQPNPPVLSFETLDAPRFDGPEYAEKLRAWWSYKYRDRRFDLIVALGEETVRFLAEHDGDPWPQTPVLFAEVGGVRVDTARHLPHAEGMIFEEHFQAALRVVKSILPATTHVALIRGASLTESDRWNSFDEGVRGAGLGLTPIVLAGLSMEDLLFKVAHLPEHTVIYILAPTIDAQGRVLPQHVACELISSASNRPAFSMPAQDLGCGIVGGLLRDFSRIGRLVGEHALRKLQAHSSQSTRVHVVLAIYAKDDESLETILEQGRQSQRDLTQISVVRRLKFSELPNGRNPFGFRDGLHNPLVEGSGAPVQPGCGPAIKAGEFIMGYPDGLGETASHPEPEVLRRNGTFLAVRKFHTKVAAFRKYLREQASSPEEEELIAAKMIGRWRSGAPLVLASERDDPALGGDSARNDAFSYADDMKGLKCPFSSHIRRVNPRDALKDDIVAVNLHHFLRRGTNYGPPLPEGVLEDDGAERGGIFLMVGAHQRQQFEFVQSQWVNDGNFISHGREQDPLLGNSEGDGIYTIPKKPVRRRLHGMPQFVAVRGGEYCFMPGLRALQWLADLDAADRGSEQG